MVTGLTSGSTPADRGGAGPVGVERDVADRRTWGARDAAGEPVGGCRAGVVGVGSHTGAHGAATLARAHASPAGDRPILIREADVRPRSDVAACTCGRRSFGACGRRGLPDPTRRRLPPGVGGLGGR